MTALDHGYVPEEHAPDPVISHGDPTMPGKIGIWLFLASEIMFFIGILGTYIIYRSGAPVLFSRHGETLSKSLAALNTVVLIFSSLTMALAVDAAQKGDRKRLVTALLVTLLCAFTFMGVKAIEYTDKLHHHTIVASADAEAVIKADVKVDPKPDAAAAAATTTTAPSLALYATVTSPTRQVFNVSTAAFESSNPRRWSSYVIRMSPGDAPGTYKAVIPAGAAGPNKINVYRQVGAEPVSKDKPVPGTSAEYGGGVFVFDGHATDKGDGTYAFTGWRAPYPKDGKGVDVNLLSEADVKAMPGAVELADETPIQKARINADTTYGPWKNNFFASYFTLTGVHGLHVIGGIIPLSILLLQGLRGRLFPNQTEYVGLYWHFVDLVWIFLFPLLYLI